VVKRHSSGRGTSVDQAFRNRLHPEVEAFQSSGSEQDKVTGLSKHDVVPGAPSAKAHHHNTGPALEDRAVSLTEVPPIVAFDSDGLEHMSRYP
jgi:hypothetical protein